MTALSIIWLTYASAVLLLVAMLSYGVGDRLPRVWRYLLLATGLIVALVPSAVPGTQSLAPAWLTSAFEMALNRPDIASAAFRPVILSLAAFYLFVFALFLLRRYRRQP